MSLRGDDRYRRHVGAAATKMRSMLRRLTVTLTESALWQLAGATDEAEEDVEVFSGIGFYARPPVSGTDPEVLRVLVGGKTAHPAVVASRDEKQRVALTAIRDLAPDESASYTTKARVHILADGTVMVDDGSGAVALATKADVDALASFAGTHTHPHGDPTTGPANGTPPSAAGTSVLRGK